MDAITLEQAAQALQAAAHCSGRPPRAKTSLTNVGRFGPYIKYGAKYVSLKEDDPYTVELPRALELIRLKQKPTRTASSRASRATASGAERALRPVRHER